MMGSSHAVVLDRPQLGPLDRLAAWLATGLSVWILFETVWHALRPDDPLAPLSLLSRRAAVLGAIQVTALTAGCAVLAAVLAGKRIADIGLFAALLGLTAVSCRGETAEHFLLEMTKPPGSGRGLAAGFLIESIAWLGISAGALLAGGVVMKWRHRGVVHVAEPGERPALPLLPALADAPVVGQWFAGEPALRTHVDAGVKHTVVVTAAGLFAFLILSIGSTSRAIQHGQAVFTVAASVCIACYIAFHVAPVRSALWPITGVALMVVVAYIWAAFRPAAPDLPPTVPTSPFLRVLPIQFVSVGLATAVAMTWYMYDPFSAETDHPRRQHAARL